MNEYGFLETPYRPVDKATGIVSKKYEYKMADIEDKAYIAQATEPLDENGRFINKRVMARHGATMGEVPASQIDYMDVSPRQYISVASALIPFLNSNEVNRVLMGANMQRQAVPVLRPEAPIVGTGMEYRAARDSGALGLAKRAGTVSYVSADEIRILTEKGDEDIYPLTKFEKPTPKPVTTKNLVLKKAKRLKKAM